MVPATTFVPFSTPMISPRLRLRPTDRTLRVGAHATCSKVAQPVTASAGSQSAPRIASTVLTVAATIAAVCFVTTVAPVNLTHATPRGLPDVVLHGKPRVVDGDTLAFEKERVRLFALDAPELKQTCTLHNVPVRCGLDSKNALQSIVDNARFVDCIPVPGSAGRDQYGRIVAKCRVHSVDVGELLVRQGHAVADARFGNDYVASENKARIENRYVATSPISSFQFRIFEHRLRSHFLIHYIQCIPPARC